jgi:hypothetical protein
MVTCVFKVDSITMYQHGSVKVSMTPVYSTDPNHPNKAFWDATPSG